MARKKEEKEEKTQDDVEDDTAATAAKVPQAVKVQGEIEEEFTEEDEAHYAFPMAPIVRLMKQEMDEDKMIRRRVKEAMNDWLAQLCRKVAKKMNQSDYTMVEIDDFKTAIEAYDMVEDTEQERVRIVATLEKVKQDCDSLIMDVNRKFVAP
jgi:hypothetical protein